MHKPTAPVRDRVVLDRPVPPTRIKTDPPAVSVEMDKEVRTNVLVHQWLGCRLRSPEHFLFFLKSSRTFVSSAMRVESTGNTSETYSNADFRIDMIVFAALTPHAIAIVTVLPASQTKAPRAKLSAS